MAQTARHCAFPDGARIGATAAFQRHLFRPRQTPMLDDLSPQQYAVALRLSPIKASWLAPVAR
jgi:hypothetical protein